MVEGDRPQGSESVAHSFYYAFQGIWEGWCRERNFRIQCLYAALVIASLFWLRPELLQVALVASGVLLLLAAELANTALERLVDMVQPELHPLAKSSKDLSAAAVLIVSWASALLTAVVFWPLLPLASSLGLWGAFVWLSWLRFSR